MRTDGFETRHNLQHGFTQQVESDELERFLNSTKKLWFQFFFCENSSALNCDEKQLFVLIDQLLFFNVGKKNKSRKSLPWQLVTLPVCAQITELRRLFSPFFLLPFCVIREWQWRLSEKMLWCVLKNTIIINSHYFRPCRRCRWKMLSSLLRILLFHSKYLPHWILFQGEIQYLIIVKLLV